MKRIFIAIELPEEIKQKFIQIQGLLKELPAKWIKSEHMHLTLVFLGDIKEGKISEIIKVCQKIAQNFKPFIIKFQGIGVFPIINKANILWVGIKDSQNLNNLQQQLSLGLQNLGFMIEKRDFKPHLTLARFRQKQNLQDKIEQLQKQEFGKVTVENFYIFESELTPEGPIHKVIKNIELSN